MCLGIKWIWIWVSVLLFNSSVLRKVSWVLANIIRQEKEMKGIYIHWEGRNITTFVGRWRDCLYRKSKRIDKKDPGTSKQ